jgi:hypothetical protein
MAHNDDHIIRVIGRGKLKQVFVGIYGNEDSAANQEIKRKALSLGAGRPEKRPLEIDFFDASSAHVWG